jgi:hypothetical protein
MAAIGSFPGLSELLAWPIEHLTEGADHWEAVGGQCYGVAGRIWQDSLSVDWEGEAADKLRTATHADMVLTSAVADQLQEAAKVDRGGASDLSAARSRLQYAVEDAREGGFEVGEDLSVTDRSTGGSPAQQAARLAQAQTFATEIRQRFAQLVGLDQQVAAKIATAMNGIGNITFPPSPVLSAPTKPDRAQAFDHTWKQDPAPAPQPAPGPTNGPTADDIRRARQTPSGQ